MALMIIVYYMCCFLALSIVKKYQDPVIAVPQISSVKTVLSLMSQVTTSSQLVQALIRGLGGHLLATQLTTFANEVSIVEGLYF